MQQITVPQFLDVEDKIIGPITVRQFIEILAGALLCFIFYKIFDFSLFIVLTLITGGLVLVIAFVRINGQAFHHFLLNFIITLKNPKLKVWKHEVKMQKSKKAKGEEGDVSMITVRTAKPVSASKLSELSLIVDTGGMYQGEEQINENNIAPAQGQTSPKDQVPLAENRIVP